MKAAETRFTPEEEAFRAEARVPNPKALLQPAPGAAAAPHGTPASPQGQGQMLQNGNPVMPQGLNPAIAQAINQG